MFSVSGSAAGDRGSVGRRVTAVFRAWRVPGCRSGGGRLRGPAGGRDGIPGTGGLPAGRVVRSGATRRADADPGFGGSGGHAAGSVREALAGFGLVIAGAACRAASLAVPRTSSV